MKAGERRVLVVGGAGYVGSVLARELLGAGYGVRVLDNLAFGQRAALRGLLGHPRFTFLLGDLRSAVDRERALRDATDVVLLAGLVGDPLCRRHPALARSVNEAASAELFSELEGRGIGRFVFTSTCSSYGLRATDEPASEESELAPLSLYAETKVSFERHVLERATGVDFAATVLRLATAHGLSPRMRFDLTVAQFARALAQDEPLVVYDADTWRPYCHVNDVSRAVIAALGAPSEAVAGEVFNVGAEAENYTKRMIVDTVIERLGEWGRVRYVDSEVDPRNYRVSFAKITRRLGFHPTLTVGDTVEALLEAVRNGAYDDFDARPSFYGNHELDGPPAAFSAPERTMG